MHLTNASINKDNLDKGLLKSEGQYKIHDNMWERQDFNQYLESEYQTTFEKALMPQIKQGVIDSILAAKEVLQHRDRSHELFGYDFMVDTDLNVWLIEVNASPSMEYSTPITKKLVQSVMPQIVRIVLEHGHGTGKGRECGSKIENFELIYK